MRGRAERMGNLIAISCLLIALAINYAICKAIEVMAGDEKEGE